MLQRLKKLFPRAVLSMEEVYIYIYIYCVRQLLRIDNISVCCSRSFSSNMVLLIGREVAPGENAQ